MIVPTAGRKSLRRTLRRLRAQDEGDIEVIVVSDGPQPTARTIACEEAMRWAAISYIEGPLTRNWGNAQRMIGIRRAAGRYLMFIDDDDVTKRGAFRTIRRLVSQDPGRLIVFRIRFNGRILWKDPEVTLGNVATPQVVVPNIPGKVGSWLTRDWRASDFDFISECVQLQGEPIWNRYVVAVTGPFLLWEPVGWLQRRAFRWRRRIWEVRTRLMIRTRLRRVRRIS